MRLILASQSPARLHTLRRAGLRPEVIVSGVDEDAITAPTPAELVAALAAAKGDAVVAELGEADAIVIACDTLLEFDDVCCGKPGDAATAIAQWKQMRGRSGILHTGHAITRIGAGREPRRLVRVATTRVTFADLSDEEIEAYVATGEPQRVAGGFTVDGLGGPFVSRIEGDHHNVVGISLPLVRLMLADLGLPWTQIWQPEARDE